MKGFIFQLVYPVFHLFPLITIANEIRYTELPETGQNVTSYSWIKADVTRQLRKSSAKCAVTLVICVYE